MEIKIVMVIFLVRLEELIVVGLGLILIVRILRNLFWYWRGINILVILLLGVWCCCIKGWLKLWGLIWGNLMCCFRVREF